MTFYVLKNFVIRETILFKNIFIAISL